VGRGRASPPNTEENDDKIWEHARPTPRHVDGLSAEVILERDRKAQQRRSHSKGTAVATEPVHRRQRPSEKPLQARKGRIDPLRSEIPRHTIGKESRHKTHRGKVPRPIQASGQNRPDASQAPEEIHHPRTRPSNSQNIGDMHHLPEDHPCHQAPQMAPLPTNLMDPSFRCFKTLGIDYAGPFYTREPYQKEDEKKKNQGMVCSCLSCLQTRAVHFDLCPSMNTDATIQALVRFSSLLGKPKILYSDNALGFHAARGGVLTLPWFADPKPLTKELMQWKFIIPRAPHQGGRWERMVVSMKRALRAYTSSRGRKEDHFRTVLVRAADILNSQPLLLRSQVELSDPLTPDHFLNTRVRDLDVNTDSGKSTKESKPPQRSFVNSSPAICSLRTGKGRLGEETKKETWLSYLRSRPWANQTGLWESS